VRVLRNLLDRERTSNEWKVGKCGVLFVLSYTERRSSDCIMVSVMNVLLSPNLEDRFLVAVTSRLFTLTASFTIDI
jgi:hypothetical protein